MAFTNIPNNLPRRISLSYTESFRQMLNDGTDSDITFYVGKNRVPINAHKLILTVRSPGFRTFFSQPYNRQNYEFRNIEPEKFKAFLDFIYTGEYPRPYGVSISLLSLAMKFEVKDLLEFYLPALRENIRVENCFRFLELFHKMEFEEMIQELVKFICKNASKVFTETNEGFMGLSINQLLRLLPLDELEIEEMKLFEGLLSWGKSQYTQELNHARRKSLRSILEQLIPLIRFPLMPLSEFAWKVPKALILTEGEINSILIYLAVEPSKRSEVLPTYFNTKPRKTKPIHRSRIADEITVRCNFMQGNSN